MFRLPKSLVAAVAGASFFTSVCGEGFACPPRGGGGGYRPVYQQAYQPRYVQPQAYQPQCQPQLHVHPQQQPLVQGQQPALTQQQLMQQQMLGQQPSQQMQQGQFGQQPMQGQVGQQGQFAQQTQQGQFAQQQGAQQTGVQQTQFTQQGQVAQQGIAQQGGQQTQIAQQNVQQGVQQPATGGAASSALNALGAEGGQPAQTQQSQPVQQQPVQQQAQAQPAQPQTVQTAPSANSEAASRSATDMALEALLGGSQPVAQEAAPANAIPTGDFSASVSNGAQVRLSLRNDNSFQWIAIKDQKQSTFSGNFSLNGSALTLLRSDSQKLEGTLTQTAAGFQLKFAGQNDNGLSFVRTNTLASR